MIRNFGGIEETAEGLVIIKILETDNMFSELRLSKSQKAFIARQLSRKFDIISCLVHEDKRTLPYELIINLFNDDPNICLNEKGNRYLKIKEDSEDQYNLNPCGEIELVEAEPCAINKL